MASAEGSVAEPLRVEPEKKHVVPSVRSLVADLAEGETTRLRRSEGFFPGVTLMNSRKPRRVEPEEFRVHPPLPRGPRRLAGLVPAWLPEAVPRPPTALPLSQGFHPASSSFLNTVPRTARSPHPSSRSDGCAVSAMAGLFHLQFVSVVLYSPTPLQDVRVPPLLTRKHERHGPSVQLRRLRTTLSSLKAFVFPKETRMDPAAALCVTTLSSQQPQFTAIPFFCNPDVVSIVDISPTRCQQQSPLTPRRHTRRSSINSSDGLGFPSSALSCLLLPFHHGKDAQPAWRCTHRSPGKSSDQPVTG